MRYVVVVAHPDDEVLFASSVLRQAEKVIVCFSGVRDNERLSRGRVNVRKELPYRHMFLDIKQPEKSAGKTLEDMLLSKAPIVGETYEILEKFYSGRTSMLLGLLVSRLKSLIEGYTVYTHNAWGEYGHPDHILVHRAVEICDEFTNSETYHFSYCSEATVYQANEYLGKRRISEVRTYSVDLGYYDICAAAYIRHKAWTWFNRYQPRKVESFFRPKTGEQDEQSMGKGEKKGIVVLPMGLMGLKLIKQPLLLSIPLSRRSRIGLRLLRVALRVYRIALKNYIDLKLFIKDLSKRSLRHGS